MSRAGRTWSFEERDRQRVDALLVSFLAETGTRCALVVDRDGQLLTTVGEPPGFDGISFATLAAADFAASAQLARQLGEPEFTSLYHEAERGSLYLLDLSGLALLAALFDGHTTLGMVRLGCRELLPRLTAVFDEVATRQHEPSRVLQGDWADEASQQIDRLFNE